MIIRCFAVGYVIKVFILNLVIGICFGYFLWTISISDVDVYNLDKNSAIQDGIVYSEVTAVAPFTNMV